MTEVIEVKVPRLAESVSEAVLAEWLKPDGAPVHADEPVATLETDKAAVEITAPEAGVLRHARGAGGTVVVGDVLARIEPAALGDGAATAAPVVASPARGATTPATPPSAPPAPAPTDAAGAPEPAAGPAARRVMEQRGLVPSLVPGGGPRGRITKQDAERAAARGPVPPAPVPPTPAAPGPWAPAGPPEPLATPAAGRERIVPMSRVRQRIAERLVQAQHAAAILTTFNEIDMSAVIDARARYRDAFERKHGVRLGYMSFFARGAVQALAEIPELNAEIRGADIVYRDAVHLGVAVGTDRGLIVPVVRDAQALGFAGLEREIARLAARARDNTLSLDELLGGTFTISNGGVYGSLLSTPILNPPQSGILGMHKIEKRPVVVDDQVVVRPMMYVALSYDHRLVDGEQAVTFLVRVKERLEAPERLLLEV